MPDDFAPSPRCTLLIPSGTPRDPTKHHLFVILTPRCDNHSHLLVPICSIVDGIRFDQTCLLEAGCHEFLVRRSYVLYSKCDNVHHVRLVDLVEKQYYHVKDQLEQRFFDEVCDGVLTSPFTPRWARNYYRLNALPPAANNPSTGG